MPIKNKEKRYIFISDIHGCYCELIALMNKIAPRPSDVVVSVGDFLDRGPNPDLCLKYWMEKNYLSVLGNHDERIVNWSQNKKVPKGEDLDRTIELIGKRQEFVDYLNRLPLILYFEEIKVIVVHAAININKDINIQLSSKTDKDIFLRGRYIRRDKSIWKYVTLGQDVGTDCLWSEIWQGPEIIIYGHTPNHNGLPTVFNNAIGIDTACVYGKSLTAAIFNTITGWTFMSVAAQKRYWEPANKNNMIIV